MEVLSYFVEQEAEESIWGVIETGALGFSSDFTQECVKFVLGKELWNVSRRQQVINVNQEFVISDLSISQDEQQSIALGTSFGEHVLDVDLEISQLVA